MNARLLMTKVVRSLRGDGLRATLQKSWDNLASLHHADDFDLRHGTDTGGRAPLWNFTIKSPNARYGAGYQVTQEHDLVQAVEFLRIDPHGFSFVDLGCGKARTLIVAARLGFRRVIGVEFVAALAAIARKNLAAMKISNAEVLHADAAHFQFPDGATVLYLYNPFSKEVMSKVIENLRSCRPEQLYIIYKVPTCAGVLDSSGFLRSLGGPASAGSIRVWTTGSVDNRPGQDSVHP